VVSFSILEFAAAGRQGFSTLRGLVCLGAPGVFAVYPADREACPSGHANDSEQPLPSKNYSHLT
jgi:hypothetical protein